MYGSAEVCNCIALRQASRNVARHFEQAFASLGITIKQYAVLVKLDRAGPLPIAHLAEALVLDRSTMAYVLKGIVLRRLVAVERAGPDRRRRLVTLTDAGRVLFNDAKKRWQTVNARFDDAIGDGRALALREVLKDVERVDLRPVA